MQLPISVIVPSIFRVKLVWIVGRTWGGDDAPRPTDGGRIMLLPSFERKLNLFDDPVIWHERMTLQVDMLPVRPIMPAKSLFSRQLSIIVTAL
jgi:hypothetical protein